MSEKRFTFEYDDGQWGVPLFYDDGKKLCFDDVVVLLNEQQDTIEEQNKLIEKLRWDLDKTREDLNYFANLKVMAMKGCEPNE